MKLLATTTALLAALASVAPAHAHSGDNSAKLRAVKWLKAAYSRQTLGVTTEKMSCTGANGTSVSYQTTTRDARTF